MALSIFTSGAAMSSTNALNKSNSILSTAMERLGTGKRINSAADDAAGLQIATRLQGQVNGMGVAQRNVADATAMLQTAEGAFDEVTNILYRMKDLATQSANATNSVDDRTALQGEVDQLNAELKNILTNTSFGGEKLIFGTDGDTATSKLGQSMSFQIGASAAETLTFDLTSYGDSSKNLIKDLANTFGLTADATQKGKALEKARNDLKGPENIYNDAKKALDAKNTELKSYEDIAGGFDLPANVPQAITDKIAAIKVEIGDAGTGLTKTYNDAQVAFVPLKAIEEVAAKQYSESAGVGAVDLTNGDNSGITTIEKALESIGSVRSALGSNINRLGHTAANLSNMKDTTTLALGNIRDADFATEATNMTRNQMLAQTSMSMLKQANSMSGMVMSLLG
ncbi:flagellin [Buttiauxella noackiae]|uniref:flagellin N-terminal helical domain-containing protein n=1 Tax=Buttiauxella noackiae TaxID=82992 RepID=UPI00054D39A5|nr:flagellin [Buttiauxella noackiae]